ncbi:hypothetical protein ACWE42_16000 [Sutcliffiella cohnii]
MSSIFIKQKLLPEKLRRIFIQLDGQKLCYEGQVKINELQMRDGIVSIELVLKASKLPEVIVEYNPSAINQITAEELGLNKAERTSS